MNDQEKWKKQLDQELELIQFTKIEQVLAQTHPKTFKQKWSQWLNKEISLPLVPLVAATSIFLAIGVFQTLDLNEVESRELIEIQGNIYWSDMIAERMKQS
ncbi:hypothetical protein [Halalkalibacter akibai]|uniref:Uncharacterized protein n=1 Tax=Halalkalibacter akibai (strain ATCC 43226 / DSM 21942 / CIP 109018 / JCM 9157 / 1139) TaxID=1236973 RepID=W4QTL5_HALA3|nr:hypothetical protein [Halalkalibacter akibai]GAE34938.1 hypothetical protein JCM9157_2022 [Halalkalibacter akibai JCM 9157]